MDPSSFFSRLAGRDDESASRRPAETVYSAQGTTPAAPTGSAAAAAPPAYDHTRLSPEASGYMRKNAKPAPSTEEHFSLPKKRVAEAVRGAGAPVSLPDSGDGDGDGAGVGGSERPNMLKEWCGILYYSCRDVTLTGYRAIRSATTAGFTKAAFEDESWSFLHDCPMHQSHRGPFAKVYRYYASLATTRTCAWMLPGVSDAPLVFHLAMLFIGLEAIQATSFYIRYRRAMRKTAEAFSEAEASAEDDEAAEEADNEQDGEEGGVTPARGASESSPTRTTRARLPRGSSRAMHRLCSYWGLLEKAVRRAPQKHAGVPTTAAELGRFFGAANMGDSAANTDVDEQRQRPPTSTTSNGSQKRFTSDGVPHGAEKVLVLSDEHTFPIIHRGYDNAESELTTANATVSSSVDLFAPLVSTTTTMGSSSPAPQHGAGCRSGTATPAAGVGSAPSPPRGLPPVYPASLEATQRSHGATSPSFTTPITTPAVTINEIAQPWEVFHCLWTDTVRYSVNYTEIRQLLLGCSVAEIAKLFEEEEEEGHWHLGIGGSRTGRGRVFRHLWRNISHTSRRPSTEALASESEGQIDSPLHHSAAASFSAHCLASPSSHAAAATPSPQPSLRYTDGRVCVACMALTWYLAVIREVYESVVVYQDVQRCADALDELEEYQRAVYQRGVEVGAAFFEEALRYAQSHGIGSSRNSSRHHRDDGSREPTTASDTTHRCDCSEARAPGEQPPPTNNDTNNNNNNACPRCLLVPQMASGTGADAAHDVVVQPLPPFTPPFPPHLNDDGAPMQPAQQQQQQQQQQRYGISNSNPLAFDFSSSSLAPHVCVTLRGASPRACWAELTAALAALLRRRRLMELACVRSLFCYMYTGSATKIVSFTILALLTSLSSRISALGQASREAISSNLDTYYRAAAAAARSCSRRHGDGGGGGGWQRGGCGRSSGGGSGCGGGGGGGDEGTPVGTRIIALVVFECMRLAVNTVLAKTTNEYITLSASQRRNTMKTELYEALTRMPLAFFDLHSYDEVEQIVYYVNDIEGVEVHVHNYLYGLITSLFAVQHALRQLPFRARVLVGLTVAASLGVKYVGQRVNGWTQAAQRTGGVLPPWLRGYGLDGTVSATAELDAQVEENMESNARQGGVMLRGLDIVAVLPQLRPYAADLSLMRWWTNHTRLCGAASGTTEATTLAEGLVVLPRQLYGKMLPALGGAMMTFADWVLPTVVSSYGASMAFSGVDALSLSNRLIEAMRCVGDMVDTVMDARRVVEVVLLNAYKANVLEKVLDRRRWEPTTMDFMKDYAYDGVDSEDDDDNESSNTGKPDVTRGRDEGSTSAATQQTQQRHHSQTLAKSFCRASHGHPSFMVRCWGRALYAAAWLVAHSPPVLMLQGTLYLARRGFRRLGVIAEETRGPSALAGASMDRKGQLRRLQRHGRHRLGHHRHRRHHRQQRERSQQADSQPRHLSPAPRASSLPTPEEGGEEYGSSSGGGGAVGSGSGSLATPFINVERYGSGGGGSVSDGACTEVYNSDIPPHSGRVDARSSPSSPSSSSSTASCSTSVAASSSDRDEGTAGDDDDDDDDLTSETAAAAAVAAALVSATVHAVTVQNLQFYYPTAPTVPVFPKPVTCSFTLQMEEWLSPSSSAPPPGDPTRGRLVCLVGPSGHGKSTLLSLLLGMYTHYGAPGQRSGASNGGGCFPDATASSETVSATARGGWTPERASAAADTPIGSGSEDGDTVSFGSPRLADPATLSSVPPDLLLTLRIPQPARRRRSLSGRDGPAQSALSSPSSATTKFVEEQLPVSVIPRDILRGNLFSFVPQSPVIFSGATIAHNISLENYISLEQEDLLAEIAQCAAWAHCEYIERFPQGLMTYIADSGTGAWSSSLASAAAGSGGAGGGGGMVRLSGGQAQRLMMARALFHGRRGGTVLVMDEPTASLDHEVKMEILTEWRELLEKGIVRGMICATHDADLVNVADEVVRLP